MIDFLVARAACLRLPAERASVPLEDSLLKVRPSVRPMCEKCRVIRRHGNVLVICSNPRHKQEAGLMARIAGVNIPREKRVEIGLTYIFGIGRSTSLKVLAELGLEPRHEGARPHRRGGRPAAHAHRLRA